jgi:hypothetical protein
MTGCEIQWQARKNSSLHPNTFSVSVLFTYISTTYNAQKLHETITQAIPDSLFNIQKHCS